MRKGGGALIKVSIAIIHIIVIGIFQSGIEPANSQSVVKHIAAFFNPQSMTVWTGASNPQSVVKHLSSFFNPQSVAIRRGSDSESVGII